VNWADEILGIHRLPVFAGVTRDALVVPEHLDRRRARTKLQFLVRELDSPATLDTLAGFRYTQYLIYHITFARHESTGDGSSISLRVGGEAVHCENVLLVRRNLLRRGLSTRTSDSLTKLTKRRRGDRRL
jgi:hypothetical protein